MQQLATRYTSAQKKKIIGIITFIFSRKNILSCSMASRKIVASTNGTEWKRDYTLL